MVENLVEHEIKMKYTFSELCQLEKQGDTLLKSQSIWYLRNKTFPYSFQNTHTQNPPLDIE